MFEWLWRLINPPDMTDAEIDELNHRIARLLNQTPKTLNILVRSSDQIKSLLPSNPSAEAWGVAWPSGTIIVRRKWRWILAHEIAHVYGADEPTARKFEDL